MDASSLIFVVEDEHLIKDLLEDALKEAGFAVATASMGAEAMQMLETANADYRALVTDVHLPPGELTGWDVANRARELNPEIPVAYMTGAAGHDWASNGVPNSVLVLKPFDAAQVVTTIAQLFRKDNLPDAQAACATPPVDVR